MSAMTVLSEDEARAIAGPLLARTLGPFGYDHVEVGAGGDHDGDEALFIVAVLKPNSPILESETYSEAYAAVDDAFRAKGERRFSYFKVSRPDEPVIEDEEA